jgi:hypothetical protein
MTIEELRQDIEKMNDLNDQIIENKDKHIKILEDHIIELRTIIDKYILKRIDGESNNQV